MKVNRMMERKSHKKKKTPYIDDFNSLFIKIYKNYHIAQMTKCTNTNGLQHYPEGNSTHYSQD